MRIQLVSAVAISLALGGCGSDGGIDSASSAAPPQLLPLSDVVNAIKCELSETFRGRDYLKTLVAQDEKDKADIKATLGLKNVLARSSSVEGGAAATALGITFGPSASGSRARTTGQSIEIEFSYDVEEAMTTPAFCASLEPRVRVKGDPFVDILDGVKEQYLRFGHGQPKVQLGSVAYTSEFEVETERSGGFSLNFLIFSIGAKHGETQGHSQSLTLAFDLSMAPPVILNQ